MTTQNMNWLDDCPVIELPGQEQARVVADAVATAGKLATNNYVDLYVNTEFAGGFIGTTGDLQHVIVHGMGEESMDSLVLKADWWRGSTQCRSARTTYRPTNSQPAFEQVVTHKWLQSDPASGLQLVSANEAQDGSPEVVASEQTSLESIQDMLKVIGGSASRLPETDSQFAPYNLQMSGDSFVADAQLFVPVAANVATGIAGVVGRKLPEGHHISAAMKFDVASSGRVYNRDASLTGQAKIMLSAIDTGRRKGMDFKLVFDHLTRTRGIEYVIAKGYLRTEDRSKKGRVVTKDTLGQRWGQMTVSGQRLVTGKDVQKLDTEVVQNNIITEMAQRVIDFAAEGLEQKS